MRTSLFLLLVLALPLSAQAQADLEGAWTLTFMMGEDNTPTLDLKATVAADTLHLAAISEHGEQPLENVSLIDDVLKFDFNTGHGTIGCTLYRKDEEEGLSGICSGHAGEIPTTMKRAK